MKTMNSLLLKHSFMTNQIFKSYNINTQFVMSNKLSVGFSQHYGGGGDHKTTSLRKF